ncbi:hypothetical protein [Pseudomonas sp. AIG]
MSTTAPQALKPLYIPAMTTLKPTEHYAGGIPIRAVENGLQIIVPAYLSMALGDKIEVFCFGTVLSKTLEFASELNRDVIFTLAKGFVLDGDAADIYYKITIKNQDPEESTPRWTLLVKLTRPGDYDDIGGDDGHSDFNFTLDRYVIDDTFTEKDVVKMRIVTYRNLTKYDRIHCRWGSQAVFHDVTPEQALDPLNHPIDIVFDYKLIDAAGDGPKVAVAFQVVDRCGNYPDERAPWSAITNVLVDMAGNRLDEPLVLVNGQPTLRVDLDQLGGNDVNVRVYTTSKDFAVGDDVLLTWTGTPAQGPQIIVGPLLMTVEFVPFQLDFTIPNEAVRAIAKGSASVGFIRRRGDDDRLSKNASVSVVGDIRELEAPSVKEVVGGTLPPDTNNATVNIPWYFGRNSSDLVNLIWVAAKPGGGTEYYEDPRPVGSVPENEPILRSVSNANIRRFDGLSVKVYYVVTNSEAQLLSVRESLPFTMLVGVALPTFDAPEVEEASADGTLNPDNVPATGATPVLTELNTRDKDRFYFDWIGLANGGSYSDHIDLIPATAGKRVRVTVPKQYVTNNLNGTVVVKYRLQRNGETLGHSRELTLRIGVVEFKLPVATFHEATGAQKDQLNPDDIYPNGATVVIAATALLKEDDEITVIVEGKTTTTHPHKVSSTEAGKELTSIKIPHARIETEDGGEIVLSYTVDRKAGGTDGPSDPAVYDVRKGVVEEKLRVLGARCDHPRIRPSGSPRRILSAFHAETGQPVEAQWKYASDLQWTIAETWRDDFPHEPLQVRTADAQVTINPININGNVGSFIAIRDEGDMVGWGDSEDGGSIPGDIALLKDIVAVSSALRAYAVTRVHGTVHAWGGAGGDMGSNDPSGFAQVIGNTLAFAGIKITGRVIAWGTASSGGALPEEISDLTDIIRLSGTAAAFAAQRAKGEIVTWGLSEFGGEIPVEIGRLTDIKTLIGNHGAFAGLRSNGQIVAWGRADFGGVLPANIANLTDVDDLSAAATFAFAARRRTGHVVAWGMGPFGGEIDPVIGAMTDIREVIAGYLAFAARRATGHVVAWGDSRCGGQVPSDIARLNDIVQVCNTSYAFAALRKNGTVVAWGDPEYGADVSPVADQLTQVQALYGNSRCFIALTKDGRVITWGDPALGGDSSAVQDRLRGQVSYLASPASRGLALKARRLRAADLKKPSLT